MIFVGVDWAEAHHDVCVLDDQGAVLGRRWVDEGVAGIAELHALVAEHADDPREVAVGIELDRGLLVGALVTVGYEVYAVNPLASARYRERHSVSGAKSDRGDAKVLADLVRTDRHNHRRLAGDSELVDAVKVLARAHQSAIWSRQRHLNSLRSALREYYRAALEAFGTDLASSDATSVLGIAPTPEQGRLLSRTKIASALRRGGRQRNIDTRAAEIHTALRSEQLAAPARLSAAYGIVARSTVAVIVSLTQEITSLEEALGEGFDEHPDAKIVRSLPGLGTVLGARELGEFGDDRTRFATAKCRKNFAGSAPITKASGRSQVVLARHARPRRLADALDQWAFCTLTPSRRGVSRVRRMANRRDAIKMTPEEVDEFLQGRHVMNVATLGPTGQPHLVAMWYGFVDGQPAFWTFGKAQKVLNLRRDPRITVLVEDGDTYDELRGVELVGTGQIVDDYDTVLQIGLSVAERYTGPAAVSDAARPFLEAQARKRVGVLVHVEHVVSWDHRKLGGGY